MKTTRISGTVLHKNKYTTNPDVTPEDRFIAAMDIMSQELKGSPPEHLSDTMLEQLTKLGKMLKLKIADNYECGMHAPHRFPTPPFFWPPVTPLTPPSVPTGTENLSPPPRVKPSQRLPADNVPANRIGKPPRVEPPRCLARLAELVRKEKAEKLRDNRPAHRTRSHTHTVAQENMFSCADIMQLNMSQRKLAGRKSPIKMINAVLNKETGELMEYQHVMKNAKYCRLYETSYSTELVRVAQGIPGQAEGTDMLFFFDKNSIPVDRWRDITYSRVVLNYRPEKDDPYRVRMLN